MEYSKEFFLDEVRDGFLIPSFMKKQWAVCLDDYKKLDEICKSNGLRCTLSWGSLIGAIRHGGFVPWDDDLDVEMPREDFEKLQEIVGKEEVEGEYHIDDFTTVGNTNTARRWIEKSTLLYDADRWADRHGFPFGNAIDIFILDNIPNDQEKYDEFMRVIFLCESLRNELGEKAEGLSVPATKAKLEDLERIVGHRIHFDDDMKPNVKAFVVMDEYLKKMTAKVDASDYSSYKMANVALYIRFRRIFSSGRTFEKCFDMDYEGLTVSVPCGYDGLLRRSYDDFMFPAYVFFNHRYPSYDILADELKKEFDFELLKYKFSRDEYEKNIGERQEKCPLGDVVRENVALLLEAHAYVSGVVRGTEKTDDVADISDVMSEQTISELKDLLGQCQSLAVYVGNLIEAKVKKVYQNQPDDTAENKTDTSDNAKISMKASDIIHALESYCESVFALYEGLDKSASDSADDIKLLTDGLLSHDTILEKLTEYSYEEYREIVFLVDRADNWKSLQTIWEAAKADEDTLVTVVPVPFKYKDALGMIPEGEWEIDIDGIPEEVELTPFEEYDFESRHPDVVIFQNPYDEYSDVTSVHPYFYSSNLCKFTDELVFIPPFVLRELIPEDQRGRYTLGVFAKNPGTVYADRIIVQSEQMKQEYEAILKEVMAEEPPADKISGIGSALTDFQTRKKKEIYDNKTGKSILFYVSASMLYDHGMSGLEKMKQACEMLGDFEVVFLRDKYARDILDDMPEVLGAYEKWLDEAADSDRVKVITEISENTVESVDGYYGDAGIAMHRCRMAGKAFLMETPGKTVEDEALGTFLSDVMSRDYSVEVTDFGRKILEML